MRGKETWGQKRKKDNLSKFLEILKQFDGMEVRKFLATIELKLGLKRETASAYMRTFIDVGFMKIEDKKIILTKVKKDA